jgi:hypothetical protein
MAQGVARSSRAIMTTRMMRQRVCQCVVTNSVSMHAAPSPLLACRRPSRLARQRTLFPARAASVQLDPPGSGLAEEAELSTLVDSQMTWPARTHGAGTLREADAGTEVTICGWVDRNRDMGGLVFLDVRDHTGVLQVRRGVGAQTTQPAHDASPLALGL